MYKCQSQDVCENLRATPKRWPQQCYGVAFPRSHFAACDRHCCALAVAKKRICNSILPFEEALVQLELSHVHELECAAQQQQHIRRGSVSCRLIMQPGEAFAKPVEEYERIPSVRVSGSASKFEDMRKFSSARTCPLSVQTKWQDMSAALARNENGRSKLNSVWCPTLDELSQLSNATTSITELSGRLSSLREVGFANMGTKSLSFNKSDAVAVATKFSSSGFVCTPLHPTGKFRLSWDLLGLLLCVYELIILPLQLSSLIDSNRRVASGCCVYWSLDLGVAFATGFFTKDGHLESGFTKIANKYCRSWFLFDLVLTCVDWTMLIIGDTWISSRAMTSMIRFVRIVRLLRLIKLAPQLQSQLGRVTSQIVFTVLRLMGYISWIVLFNHYLACIWCATWSDSRRFGSENSTPAYRYLTGLHWSFAHCLLGSMDVYPADEGERVFSCLVLVISLVVFSTLLSAISNDALALRAVYAEKNNNTLLLLSFFSEHKLPAALKIKVWHYINQHNLLEGTSSQLDTARQALELLPNHVQDEIRYDWIRPLLVKHPFFRAFDTLEPLGVKDLCMSGVTIWSLLCEDELMWSSVSRQHGEVEQMIFVENGTLEYVPWDQSVALALPPGSWACEEALWSSNAKIFGRMQGGPGKCDVILLSFQSFVEVVRQHSATLHFVMRYAREFVLAFNQACTSFDHHDVLYNSPKIASYIVQAATEEWTSADSLPTSGSMQVHHGSAIMSERNKTKDTLSDTV